MPFVPRHYLPTIKDGETFPEPMQLPIVVEQRVQASQNWFDGNGGDIDAVADQISQYYSGSISHFVEAQRQNYGVGGMQVFSRQASFPGMDLRYDNQQGRERLIITVYPENAGGGSSGPDQNLDGYIAWIPNGQENGEFAPGSDLGVNYDFYLNETLIYSYFEPKLERYAIVFKFGDTALRCQSLIDPNNPNKKTPGLTNQILPARPQVQGYDNIIGNPISKHADLPGYFIYDWGNQYNNGGFQATIDNPTIRKVVTIPSKGAQSPIKNFGKNQFRVKLRPNMPYTDGFSAWYYVMYAEFYSRQDKRGVTTSWKRVATQGSILVNDEPLYWAIVAPPCPVQAIDFDLTPNKVDRTQPTPQDGTGTGYWRLGDPISSQPFPPFKPWLLALQVTQAVADAWAAAESLMSFVDGLPPIVVTGPILGYVSAANAVVSTTSTTNSQTDYYKIDYGSLTVADNAIVNASIILKVTVQTTVAGKQLTVQDIYNTVVSDASPSDKTNPSSAYTLCTQQMQLLASLVTLAKTLTSQLQELLKTMASYKPP